MYYFGLLLVLIVSVLVGIGLAPLFDKLVAKITGKPVPQHKTLFEMLFGVDND